MLRLEESPGQRSTAAPGPFPPHYGVYASFVVNTAGMLAPPMAYRTPLEAAADKKPRELSILAFGAQELVTGS